MGFKPKGDGESAARLGLDDSPNPVFWYILWTGVPIDEKGTGNIFLPDTMPVQAVEWLQENPQDGKLFNDYIWESYVLFRMWPAQTVFIDARTDFYGEKLLREYADVIHLSDGWEDILDRYQVAWMLIPREGRLPGISTRLIPITGM